jgi:hypothetical protein
MEFLPSILVFAIIATLFLRFFRGRKLEMDSPEPNGRKLGMVEGSLVEELKQRTEARRLKLKQDRFITNNSEDPHSDFLPTCSSCLRQNEPTTQYCVYCGMKLGSDLFDLTIYRSHIDRDSMPQIGGYPELKDEMDETWLEFGQDTMGKDQTLHQSITSHLPIDKQDSQGIVNPKSFTQKRFDRKIGPINQLASRIGLKHAILLSEILGPPVSISRGKIWNLPD